MAYVFMIAACAAGTTSRAGRVLLRAYQGAKNALQQTTNGAHCLLLVHLYAAAAMAHWEDSFSL